MVLPRAPTLAQAPTSTASLADPNSELLVIDKVHVLLGDAEHQAPLQDDVVAEQANKFAHPDDDGAAKGNLAYSFYTWMVHHI
jgi:hypothetical protein